MKKMFYWLVMTLLAIPAVTSAQEIEKVVDNMEIDTVEIDNVDDIVAIVDTVGITQHDLIECDSLRVCPPSKYAIVMKDGMQGIYDMALGQNVTEMEFREILFSRSEETEEGLKSAWFYTEKESLFGILCVYEDDNSIMALWMDDPDEDSSNE